MPTRGNEWACSSEDSIGMSFRLLSIERYLKIISNGIYTCNTQSIIYPV